MAKRGRPRKTRVTTETPPEVTVEQVQQVQKADHLTTRERISEIVTQAESRFLELAELLHRAKELGYAAKEWGYGSFQEWANKELSIGFRKAYYYCQIWQALSTCCPGKKAEFQALGWTKCAQIAPILTADTAERWLDLAAKHSVSELLELIKQAKGPTDPQDVRPMSFKFRSDSWITVANAIKYAKDSMGVDSEPEALELMCSQWMDYTRSGVERDLEKEISRIENLFGVELLVATPAQSAEKTEPVEETPGMAESETGESAEGENPEEDSVEGVDPDFDEYANIAACVDKVIRGDDEE